MTRCDYRDAAANPIAGKEPGFPRTFAALLRGALLCFSSSGMVGALRAADCRPGTSGFIFLERA